MKIQILIDLHKEATNNDILWLTRPVVNLLNGLGLKSIYKSSMLQVKAMKLKAIKESLKTPEVIRIRQKSIPPIHPIEPDKLKIITLGLTIGMFVAVFTAILLSGLRALKKRKTS